MPKTPASKEKPAAGRKEVLLLDPQDVTIITDPAHPLYDDRIHLPLKEDVIASIIEFGVIQPIKVRRDGKDLQIIDGRQRYRSLIEANRRIAESGSSKPPHPLPIIIRQDNDKTAARVMVILNELRQDDLPLTRARKAVRLIELNCTKDEVCRSFGLSEKTLNDLIAILDTADEIQAKANAGEISISAAAALAEIPRAQQIAVYQQIDNSGLKVTKAAVQATIRAHSEPLATTKSSSKSSPKAPEASATGGSTSTETPSNATPAAETAASQTQPTDSAGSESSPGDRPDPRIVLPPSASQVRKVMNSYPAGVTVSAVALLAWVVTGEAAEALPDPRQPRNRTTSLADFLRDSTPATTRKSA